MFKYRDHRGGLAESMETVRDFKNRSELLEYLRSNLEGFKFKDEEVEVEPYGYDDRIKWDTHIVTIEGYGVVGFTDGPI